MAVIAVAGVRRRLRLDRHRAGTEDGDGAGRRRGHPWLSGIASAEDAFYSPETGVDWDVIFLLLGMMIIVGVLRRTGVFEYVAIWAAKRAKGSPLRVMILLVLITAVASAFLDNVTTVLLIAPVTLLVCDRLDVSPDPVPDRGGAGLQHRRRRHLDRRPAQHHHRQPLRADLQRLPAQHGPDRGPGLAVFVAMLPLLFRGSFQRRSGPGGRRDGA